MEDKQDEKQPRIKPMDIEILKAIRDILSQGAASYQDCLRDPRLRGKDRDEIYRCYRAVKR